MQKTASHNNEIKAPLPQPINTNSFTSNGEKYEILRYADKGPTLAQTIEIAAKSKGKSMLTIDETRKIIDNEETNHAFKEALNPRERGYIRDTESEAQFSVGICFGRAASGLLYTNSRYYGPYEHAQVVILKETDRETEN
jgi:hypothetical protein